MANLPGLEVMCFIWSRKCRYLRYLEDQMVIELNWPNNPSSLDPALVGFTHYILGKVGPWLGILTPPAFCP